MTDIKDDTKTKVAGKKADKKLPIKPHYCAATSNGWGVEMTGTSSDDGKDYAGIIGNSITNFTIEAKEIIKARVRNKNGKWLEYKTGFDKNSGLGDSTPITGFEFVGKGFVVAVHIKGGTWLTPVFTSDRDGEVLIGASTPIDAIWIDKM